MSWDRIQRALGLADDTEFRFALGKGGRVHFCVECTGFKKPFYATTIYDLRSGVPSRPCDACVALLAGAPVARCVHILMGDDGLRDVTVTRPIGPGRG